MSELKEMPDRIWVYEANGFKESGSWTSTCTGDNETEYRRIPTLPDVMPLDENGNYIVTSFKSFSMETQVVIKWRDGAFPYWRYEETDGAALFWREKPMACFEMGLFRFDMKFDDGTHGLHDNTIYLKRTHHVQDGKIVRVK